MTTVWHRMIGRTEIARLGPELLISRHPWGQPMKWRITISTRPYKPLFSEREGWSPMPRTRRVGPLHITIHKRKEPTE